MGNKCYLIIYSISLTFVVINKTQKNMNTIYSFEQWNLDLLVDYVQKVHHRGIREKGPKVLNKLIAVAEVHKADAPNLLKVTDHFRNSLYDLDVHCNKEDSILYPYIVEMYEAYAQGHSVPPFHCGSVQSPISAMMADHDEEVSRHNRIADLTNNYTAPDSSDDDYVEAMQLLREFRQALDEHVSMENDILFPMAVKLESMVQR